MPASPSAQPDTGDLAVVRHDDRGVVHLTLNRPASFNALSRDMLTALDDAFAGIDPDPALRAVVIAAEGGCASAGVFTRSRFAGPSVTVSRENLRGGRSDAMVVISKNANVANGSDGLADAREVLDLTGALIGASPDRILLASTGVIGRRYPMERVRAGIAGLEPPSATTGLEECARAIMTTDTVPKTARAEVPTPDGDTVTVAGIAKGVGMIEPDMGTMIAVILTDAEVDPEALQALFASVVDETLNCVSVDSDTSTSDTAVVLASGACGPVDHADLRDALLTVCTSLTRQIAADGEGAETLIEVLVDGARDVEQARRVAKSIVNSPLVKTAVHGADPNWGRVAMAVGKCSEDTDIDPDRFKNNVLALADMAEYFELPTILTVEVEQFCS